MGDERHGRHDGKIVQPTIFFFIQLFDVQSQGWRYSKNVLTTNSWNNRVAETATEYPLSLQTLMNEVVAAKIEAQARPPLILQYRERQCSAFIHSGPFCRLSDYEERRTSSSLRIMICRAPILYTNHYFREDIDHAAGILAGGCRHRYRGYTLTSRDRIHRHCITNRTKSGD